MEYIEKKEIISSILGIEFDDPEYMAIGIDCEGCIVVAPTFKKKFLKEEIPTQTANPSGDNK